MNSILKIPTEIFFGVNCLDDFKLSSDKKAVIIVSRSIENDLNFLKITNYLNKNKNQYQILNKSNSSSEPESDDISDINNRIEGDVDLVIGVGGGSVLDIAKFIAVIKKSGSHPENYDLNKTPVLDALPLILIPSTCGSGSEITQYAVAANSKTKRKFTISSKSLFAQKAYIDPSFIFKLSKQHILNSSMDAFIHSFEAYVNHKKNMFVDEFALKSMTLIYNTLKGFGKREDIETVFYENLSYASLLGGISISHNRTGMIHTLSVAFSEYSSEAHGLLNAKIFNKVLSFNSQYYNGRLAEAASWISGNNYNNDDACLFFSSFISSLIPNNKINFDRSPDLAYILKRVSQDQGLKSVNLRPFNSNDLKKIVKEILCQD